MTEARAMDTIEAALGRRPTRLSRLTGGCIAEVWRAELGPGESVVAKLGPTGEGGTRLDVEAYMLRTLRERSRLPVPEVFHSEPDLLVIEFMPGQSRFGPAAERHAAELLADLHGIAPPEGRGSGLERDTLIGSLPQRNPWTASWAAFFREHRLLAMRDEAARSGRLPTPTAARIGALARRLDELIPEAQRPALLHGDVWTTNVLAQGDRITAFLDPSVYYGDPEVELAFITLFSTFGEVFFGRYHELRPIDPGFFRSRRDLYNLYPLLVHVRLFGGGYADTVAAALDRLGF